MKRFWINLVISLAIGALFVWLAARGVDWRSVLDVFAQVDLWYLLNYFLILLLVQLFRIIRWGILLKPLGEVGFVKLLAVGSVGIMALILLPLRLGEFARPLLVAERGGIRVSAALATVVVERVVDSLAMAILLVLLLFFIPDRVAVPIDLHTWAWVVLGLFLGLLCFLLLAYRYQAATLRWFTRLFGFLPDRLLDRLTGMLSSFIGGLRALPNARLLSVFLVMTVLYWGLAGVGLRTMFAAFPGLGHLGWLEAYTCLAVLCVGLMIPAGPGMIGNFHYFIKLGLSLFVGGEVLGASGVAYAIVVHAMQLGQQVVVGLPFLFSHHISFGRLLAAPARVEDRLQRSAGPGE